MTRTFARRGKGQAVPMLTPAARIVPMRAFEHALRLGHSYYGTEHHLLAMAEADEPAAGVLREHEVTPERVEAQIIRLAGGGLFGDLDRNALAAVGIDVDAVCANVAASFGADALSRASQAASRRVPPVSRWDPRRGGGRAGVHRDGVFLPAGPGCFQLMRAASLEAQARPGRPIGFQHLVLGLLAVDEGLAPAVLSALGASVPALRAAILDRGGQAG